MISRFSLRCLILILPLLFLNFDQKQKKENQIRQVMSIYIQVSQSKANCNYKGCLVTLRYKYNVISSQIWKHIRTKSKKILNFV